MNIRKFVGATSRDALRLVREALGPDAVVLSNHTMDDGSVEIVALADSDLAAITPKAPRGRAGAPMNALAGQQPALAAPRANPMMQANPYASGMPDVFSSVFGASPEAGAENMTSNAASAASSPAATSAIPAAPKAALPDAPKAALAAPAAASLSQPTSVEQPSARAAATRLTEDIRADLLKAAGVPAAPAADAPRTMAESNPWLIDHARRIAAEQQQEGAYSARPAAMTPSAATAKG
ncbi:MAG: flagellar biosynthesis protein FlhF, partial [Paraburkholderia sp.]